MADQDYPLYDPGYPGSSLFKPGGPPAGARKGDTATDPAFAWLSQYMPWNRPAYPSGAPPAPTPPASTGPAPGGAGAPSGAAQFMGLPAKTQERMPFLGGFQEHGKGDMMQPAPGGAPQPPQGGAGAPSGGGAPAQQGPLTLQGVMQSLAQANPEMMQTKEGRITLGMAALKFAPLMIKEDQLEMQRMKMEMANQISMLKFQQGEARLGMQEARLEAYESKLNAKGGTKEDKVQKEYDTVSKQADTLANHLAVNHNSKELRTRYEATMKRLQSLEEQVNPPEQGKVYEDWIKANPSRVEESVPDEVRRILSPQEFKELIDRQRADPEKAYARIKWLQQKAYGRESTVEKSYGNY
jgi:hypothetical protein